MKKQRNNKKYLVIILIIIAILVLLSGLLWYIFDKNSGSSIKNASKATNNNSKKDQNEQHPERIRLVATGDIVAHDSVNANAKQPDGNYNYYPMLENMKPIFAGSNISFCNQVTPAGGVEFGVTGYPKFNAPTELVRDLGKAGCNTINMASNHSFDVGQNAISANVKAWQEQPNILAAAGQNQSSAERDKVRYFTQKGVKFAFLAYTTYINSDAPAQNDFGATVYSRSLADKQIAEAKQNGADIIIVSMRWGTEYSPTVNSEQKTEAQYLSDQGVKLILGHGPHVLQPVDKLTGTSGNETYVWYSLGNFLNTQLEADALFNGFAIVDFSTKTKQITGISYLPIYMHYEWSTADSASENLLARKNLKLYLLDEATEAMLAANQLKTSISAQKQRINEILNSNIEVPLITKSEYGL